MRTMLRSLRIPIRIKILIALLFVVTAVVSVITFTMAQLFHADKSLYITDLTSVLAMHAAQEAEVLVVGYEERLETCARIFDDRKLSAANKSDLLQSVIYGFHSLVAISFYEGEDEVASLVDRRLLSDAGLSVADLSTYREGRPLPFDEIAAGETYIRNTTITESLPVFTLATAYEREGGEPLIVVAVLRLDELMHLSRRSGTFDVYLMDADGELLSDRNAERVAAHELVRGLPEIDLQSLNAAIVKQYSKEGVETFGGFAGVGNTQLTAIAEVPRAAAYFASRELLNQLVLVSLALLLCAALVGTFWSKQMTNSLKRLVGATQEIGRGEFGVKVDVKSGDEIGQLSNAFNQMSTELQNRENALKDAQVQLIQSEKMAAFGQLGAGFAHEIKNPLAGLLGLIQLSLRQTGGDHAFAPTLATMEKETKRCKAIVDNLLKFARQEKVIDERTEIGQVVDDVTDIMRAQLSLGDVRLEKDVEPSLPPIMGRSNELQQVLMNLILNAKQAIGDDGGSVRIEVRRCENAIEVRVVDDGPGIPEHVRSRIFEPFYSTKPTGEGTGLGLSVSYGIVKNHKGTIRVESESGSGTTFVIRLPIADAVMPSDSRTGDASEESGQHRDAA